MSDATGKVAVYDWGADGLKRSVRVQGDANSGFSYLGSVVYTPSGSSSYAIESVAFPEGRFVKTTSGFEVNYHIKDHLGSVRATMNQNGVLSNQSDYYPFGERWSASGEATANRYLFSGKEKQTAGDLQGMNLLDFGARMYDPEIPRWLTQDPLAEKYYQHSPYLYCAANPVKYVDPNGMDWYQYGGSDPVWHNSSDPELVLNGNTYSNIGTHYTKQNEDGSYTNYFQNLGFNSSKPFNAKSYMISSGKASQYLSSDSKLSNSGKAELMQSIVRKGQADFLTHPLTISVIDGVIFVATGGIESIVSLTSMVLKQMPQKVYRVYGGDAKAIGRYWTPVNPSTVVNYRYSAGLPATNTGRFVVEGTTKGSNIIKTAGGAAPIGSNAGGLTEYVINNPSSIKIKRVSGVHPTF